MARVLVVDDDDSIRRMVVLALKQAGHNVVQANSGEAGLVEFAASLPEVVVLDMMMPGINGDEVCRRIRETSQVPILMLTALAREDEVVHGLDVGADDYLTKPFGIREMLARVNALARRSLPEPARGVVAVGDILIDADRYVVTVRDERVELTRTEFRLLHCLARHAGRVVPARTLIHEAQDYDCDEREAQDIVKVHVSHLRAKLEPSPDSPRYISNVRGFGYVLDVAAGSSAQ